MAKNSGLWKNIFRQLCQLPWKARKIRERKRKKRMKKAYDLERPFLLMYTQSFLVISDGVSGVAPKTSPRESLPTDLNEMV